MRAPSVCGDRSDPAGVAGFAPPATAAASCAVLGAAGRGDHQRRAPRPISRKRSRGAGAGEERDVLIWSSRTLRKGAGAQGSI
eukprot:363348-Chlamydomonas_euryale.AAC.4